MTEAENIRHVEELNVNMIGFVFYPKSPRCVHQIPGYLPVRAKRVGVFVNESKEDVLVYTDRFGLDYVQLHGSESPEYCHSLSASGISVIKTIFITHSRDIAPTGDYEGSCSLFLFDTRPLHGNGYGKSAEWDILACYKGNTPFLLSGDISPYSSGAIGAFRHTCFAGININNRFETTPGIKDVKRIKLFLEELKRTTAG